MACVIAVASVIGAASLTALGASAATNARTDAGAAQSNNTITILYSGSEPASFDPNYSTLATSTNMYDNIFDKLDIRNAHTGKVDPALAVSWKAISPTVWDIQLRKGVKFTDGEPFNASSVVFTFGLALNPATKSLITPFISPYIASVKAVNAYDVRISTIGPYAPLPSRLLSIWMLPPKYYQTYGAANFAQHPVGTGPYKLVSWIQGDQITMTANNSYWRGKPPIGGIIWKLVNDASTRVAALEAGQADIAYQVPVQDLAALQSNPNTKVANMVSARVMIAGFNAFQPPFNNVLVRQALNYAVDKKAIIDSILGGYGRQVGSTGSPSEFGYDSKIKPYPYDPTKAKQLLAEAGYPNGFTTTWDGTAGRYQSDVQVEQAIAGYLAAVGVKVTMNLTDVGTFFNAWLAKKYNGIWFFGQGDPLLDEDYMLESMVYGPGRGWYYSSPQSDALIHQAAQETDPAARLKTYANVLQYMHTQAPWIFLWNDTTHWGLSRRINWHSDASDDLWVYSASWAKKK